MAIVQAIYFDLYSGAASSMHHGFAYLIGALRTRNNTVWFHHLSSESDCTSAIQQHKIINPDLLVLSFTTNQIYHVRSFLKELSFSKALIVAGGIHCTLMKEKIFDDFPLIKGVCIGEGELPLAELCLKIDSGADYLHTPSFYFLTEKGIVINRPLPLQPMDSLSLPDYSLFDYAKIVRANGQRFPMMISRGCPYDCSYCCNHALRETYADKEHYVRFATPPKAISIIKNNLKLYPQTKKIDFFDDTFTLDKEWLRAFSKLYREEINLPFACNARIETIGDDVVGSLDNAGCDLIVLGIESGNEWLRQHILNRNYSNEMIRNSFELIKSHKLNIGIFNMYGLPFETNKMMKDTLDLIIELRPHFGKCSYFFPYPVTKIYQLCADHNLLLPDLDSRSGYLERPSLQEKYSTHDDINKYYQATQLYYYVRILTSNFLFPAFLEKLLFKIVFVLNKPLFSICNPVSKNRFVRLIRNIGERLALRYLK